MVSCALRVPVPIRKQEAACQWQNLDLTAAFLTTVKLRVSHAWPLPGRPEGSSSSAAS